MSYFSRYDRGDWAVLCDACGRKLKASDLRQRWDGLKVCPEDWEPRQPQDFVRGVADYQAPPWTRPEPQNQYIRIYSINRTVNGAPVNTFTLGGPFTPRAGLTLTKLINGAPVNTFTLG